MSESWFDDVRKAFVPGVGYLVIVREDWRRQPWRIDTVWKNDSEASERINFLRKSNKKGV